MERIDKTYSMDEVMSLMEPLVSGWFYERFDNLTEPQARAIPVIHDRKNVLVSSPTGSGKTLTAFTSIINALTRYATEGRLEERIYCIYVSPLKALANDVNKNLNTPLAEMRALAESKGMAVPDIRVAVRSGDTTQSERQKMVRHPPHILITTPESLALILAAPRFSEKLKNLEWLILDEIHDICDSKRGAFLSLTMERLRDFCDMDFTRIGLSATLAPIEAIAGYLVGSNPDGSTRDVTLIESDSKKILDLKVICPATDMTALSSEIVNSMMYDKLKELVDAHDTTLIFTNTRSGAENVVYKLKERGLESVEVHHSSLGKDIRLDVEERLKRGEIRCVVSSTSLELGIDIGSVDLVCQIGSPKSVAKGLQRIGRSGHSFGKVAKGRLMVFDPDDLVECAVMCRAAHRSDIDRVGIPENCLDVLSQTVVGMSLDRRWGVDEAYELVKGSYCYRNLTKESFINVLGYLGSKEEHEGVYSKIWYDTEEEQFGKKKGSRMIYLMNLGTIPEEANYRVVTSHGTTAGELSEKFVERLAPRDVFVLGGRSFEFVRSKGMLAYVKEANGRKPTVPSWAGEMLPRSFDLSMDVATFRSEMAGMIDRTPEELIPLLGKEFDIDEGSARSIVSYMKEQSAVAGFIPDAKSLAVEEYIDPTGNQRLIFHFPFGRRVNDALSRAYAYRLTNDTGTNVSITVTDDNFMIGTTRRVDLHMIPGMLRSADLEPVLRKAIKGSEIFKLRFRHTAARSFMILRNYMGKPISVNRQQVRSAYLLEMLANLDNEPVIEETYREVLEDDMDVRNAEYVLQQIDSGEMQVRVLPFTGTPSPFAHTIILSGFSDIVLMEDRSALLRELHRKVLARALGDSVKEFEFDEDTLVPYFRNKIGRISCKEDIPALLRRTGPLQAIRERGRNIYAYCDEDKKTVDGWVRELLKDGIIGTVFLDEPHIMVSECIPEYASATVRERELTDVDAQVYSLIGDHTALSDITSELEISEDMTFRSVRKLESMYLVTRTDIAGNNKWFFGRAEFPEMERTAAVDSVILRYLECFAPVTVKEISFELSIPENEVETSLESLVASEDVAKGFFLVSESVQYMKMRDRLRLRSGKNNIYEYDTVENYRFNKGSSFDTIEEYFEYFGSAGNEIDVFNRVRDFDLSKWHSMRASGEILMGRFVRGKVRFVLADDGARLAAFRTDETNESDKKVYDAIVGLGSATLRRLASYTGMDKGVLKESLSRLDRSLKIIRQFNDREDWGTENTYIPYEPEEVEMDLVSLVQRNIRAYGPIPLSALRFLIGAPEDMIAEAATACGAVQILVGVSQTQMYIMPDEVPELDKGSEPDDRIRVMSPFDPALGSKWAELSARYGDKWIYALVRGSRLIGAVEMWEMSGCIEIRAMDLDSEEDLPEVLDALDFLMGFFKQKNNDILRLREVAGKGTEDLDPGTEELLESKGYMRIGDFYAKGGLVPDTMTEEESISYVLSKQKVSKLNRHPNMTACIAKRGYVRGDQEAFIRINDRMPIKSCAERDSLVKGYLIPDYVGYTSLENMSVYRACKAMRPDEDQKVILSLIHDRQPVSKKEMLAYSPYSEERLNEIVSDLFKGNMICQDPANLYIMVPGTELTRSEALKKVMVDHFNDFGMFTTDMIAVFMGIRVSLARSLLFELEKEGFLAKGFLIEGDPTLRWIVKDDLGMRIRPFTECLILNTQDNLHLYFRDMIKAKTGITECVILCGTEISASFKGKLCVAGIRVDEYQGSDRAMKYIKEQARQMGLKIQSDMDDEDDDWDISRFYQRSNPGA